MKYKMLTRLLLATTFALAAQPALTEPVAGAGHILRAIDGDNDLGEHFALADRPGGRTGFFYLADERRLIASSCLGLTCSGADPLTNPTLDRGRHVSAATRTALTNRPLLAYYDATNGDLIAADCLSPDCSFAIERTLETAGNVGQDTAIAIDPATGFAVISYYDVGNGDLRLYRCASALCNSGSSVLVDGTGDRGRNSSMVFAGSTLWIAYEDRTSGGMIRARSTSPFSTFVFVSQPGSVEPSLTADGAGLLDMVWRETVTQTLQRLRCQDATCSTGAQSTLAGAGRAFRPSATRTTSGNLMVSHAEPAANSVRGTVCPDAVCAAPQGLVFDTRPGIGGKSILRSTSNGLPLVYYQDSVRADVRAAQCTTAGCSAFILRTALNGLPVTGARVATRADGRAVVAYIRERRPWLASCSDTRCTSVARVVLPGFNSDARPAVAVRPDGRPVVYYASVGGSELYDCANADCSSGTSRAVSGSGNSTSDVIEMTLRTDGRPLLLYAVSNANDLFAFDCADVNCSSGTSRPLIDEPIASTFLANYGIAIGAEGRPLVRYMVVNFMTGTQQQRFLRCSDANCTSAMVRTLGTDPVSTAGSPLAITSNGRAAFIENGPNNFAVCDDADCQSLTRFPIGFTGTAATLQLLPLDRPVYLTAGIGFGNATVCGETACTSSVQRLMVSDSDPLSSYLGTMALDATGSPLAAFEEQTLADVLLALPLPEVIFANSFE